MRVIHDPDIGLCDECGSEDGWRRRTLRNVVVNGERMRVDVWLCPSCRRAATAEQAP